MNTGTSVDIKSNVGLARRMRSFSVSLVLASFSVVFHGCVVEDSRVQELRARFALETQPQQPTTIGQAIAELEEKEKERVLFVGQIGGDEHTVFELGKASFIVNEVLPGEHGSGDKNHVDNCLFCQRKAEEAPKALVQFVDSQGEVLGFDARELFHISPGTKVIIRGRGILDAENELFSVIADGIYVPTDKETEKHAG